MNSEFQELYREIILDHNKSPRNCREMADADRVVTGKNPLCGDNYQIFLKLDGDKIADISFQGSGCAISKASASVMTSFLKGKSVEDGEKFFNLFQQMVTGKMDPEECLDELGKLAAFAGVAEFPVRVKCATLAWHAMHTALTSEDQEASSEN